MTKKKIRLISWNLNGIRSALGKGLARFVAEEPFDVLCFQETRASFSDVDFTVPGAEIIWNEATSRKGYAGTAVFSRPKPLSSHFGLSGGPDPEGRVITVEYPDFFLVNVYTPNAQRDLARLSFRAKEWDPGFLAHVRTLDREKPVIFCGDLNVAHREIDLANPKSNVKNAGFTPEERAGFDAYLAGGFADTFRLFNKEGGNYTWWSYRFDARRRNIGWRIDYFCVSERLIPRVEKAEILSGVGGSDHCPVALTLRPG